MNARLFEGARIHLYVILDKSLQQESQKVREGVELAIKTYILISQFYTILYIRIFIIIKQPAQRGCCTIIGFYLHRNK